ncbi:MAG: hypothetical protein ACPGVU_12180 [Limisphaerales bacterium]
MVAGFNLDTLARYQPLTKLGVTMVVVGLVLGFYGWFWFSESRKLLAEGVHGIAEITEIRRDGRWRRRLILEMDTERGRERINYSFRRQRGWAWSEGERISIVYLPKAPGVFQFGKEAYLNPYGLAGGLLLLVVGIVLPIVEKRREDVGFQRDYDDSEPLSETEERQRFANLDLQAYHDWSARLQGAGFGFMGNAMPVDLPTKGGRARLERQFRSGDAVAVLYVVQPGFFAQMAGGKQEIAVELISLLANGKFIITTNYHSGHEALTKRDKVSHMQMPDSMDADMLREAHGVRLRENVGNASAVPIQDANEARKLLDGLAEFA